MEGKQTESVVPEGHDPVNQSRDLEEQDGSASFSDSLEGQKLSSCSPDLEENRGNEPLESSHIIEDTVDSELPSNSRDVDSSLSEPKWLEGDESVALWVKWRGRWQVGIRCSRADWPLSTVRGKPTHDRKKYFVIFFPHTRNYSWADTLLVRPISDYPHPIAYRTHKSGLKLVRDLTIARRFIMKKLAVGMLNIIDQFHMEALIESARDVNVWKEFAMEASQCNGYPDLGKMILKLQSMILRKFINSEWLEQSLDSWTRRCQNVETAELVEMLKEELYDSICWNEVKSLCDGPGQPVLGADRRTWKQDVMKWFSTSHPLSISSSETGPQNNSAPGPVIPDLLVARKRPKLEVRRAEVHTSPVEAKVPSTQAVVEIDSEFFKSRDSATPEPCLAGRPMASPSSVTERWDEMVVESGNNNVKLTTPESTRMNQLVVRNPIESGSRSRQCAAFIESKGRRCVRSANEGDIYCCVHLASRFLGSSAPRTERAGPTESPMCEGTTVLGTRCKHRSLPGLTFCKKHRPRDDSRRLVGPSDNVGNKRKHEEFISNLESPFSKALVVVGPVENSLGLEERPEHSGGEFVYGQAARCIGSGLPDETGQCMESPKRYSLYCDMHLPSWLKRARNGKSRIVSKEVFIELLRGCSDERQKVDLHKACDLFFRLFKSVLSLRNPVPIEVQLQWALSEASKEPHIGNFLLKLVISEKERLKRIWGFGEEDRAGKVAPSAVEEQAGVPWNDDLNDDDSILKCKICSEDFLDDRALGTHWMEAHKKEAQWLFRGYACAICLDSYTNKKVLESHVQERHHVQFVEQCKLLQCIPCRGHFGNAEELWAHVISVHPASFRLSRIAQQKIPVSEESPANTNPEPLAIVGNHNNVDNVRKFVCRFCGLKFDLLPDLGRHHQAAHMGPSLASSRPTKKGIRYYAYKLKSGRLSRPRFKKGLGSTSYRIRNRGSTGLKKRMQVSKSLTSVLTGLQSHAAAGGTASHGRLTEPQCSTIAKILFSQIQKTKPRPSNQDILSVARTACCKESIKATLEAAYGELPERLYLKAAKLCSEHNISVNWHLEGFVCPNGCRPVRETQLSSPLVPPPKGLAGQFSGHPLDHSDDDEWDVDESHYVVDPHQFKSRTLHNAIILCGDISFGRESAPIACVVDEWLLDSLHAFGSDGHDGICSMPWESFTYITKPLIDRSVGLESKSHQLGCACVQSVCRPEACDHVYLFDNDYEDAKDIYGKSMSGGLPCIRVQPLVQLR
ncbi:hypothetical protein CRG98_038009 [Punica granatum]|uniref:C2H2-type domain-containing protein n=1 Tax=Punica granatum TaxID=22663 RepID=A0A2I0IC92_PUNGR|nr:hypothetical protein CRG98_038009 [Punica granatum]